MNEVNWSLFRIGVGLTDLNRRRPALIRARRMRAKNFQGVNVINRDELIKFLNLQCKSKEFEIKSRKKTN